MDDAERRIAVFYRIHNNSHGKQIINLIQCLALVLHFLIDAEEMLDTAVYLGFDSRIFHVFGHFVHNLLDVLFPFASAYCNFIHQVIVYIRLQIFQGKVVKLHLDFGNAQALCDGRIDFHGFPGYLLLLRRRLVLQGTHIMEPVGKLYHNDADVLCHGKEHFTEVLCLHFLLIRGFIVPVPLITGEVNLLELCYAVHQKGHIRAEFLFDFLFGHDRVFHHVMKKACFYRFLIQLQIRQDNGHAERMDDIRLAGLTHLPFVGGIGNFIRFLDHRNII